MNQLKLIIGNKNYSSWSLRPWFFLKNLNIDFDEEVVFLFEDDTAQQLKPYFSNEKVPVLLNFAAGKDFQVWDSLAIIEYIAELFPDRQGWPVELTARAIARSLSAEMHSGFDALRGALPMNCRKHFPNFSISSDVQQDIDRVVATWDFAKKQYGSQGPWLFGEFSGTDAMFAPVVMRLYGYDVPLSGFAAEYIDMVVNNKHMQSWIEAGKLETRVIESDEI